MLPCYVINLEKDVERRKSITRQLDELGISYILFKAVNGKALSAEEMALHYDRDRAVQEYRSLTPGEIGCALSHRKIYQEIVEKDLMGAFIFEDDAQLIPDASNKNTKNLPPLPEVLLSIEKHFNRDENKVVLLSYVKRYQKRSCTSLIGDVQLADIYGYTFGTHAYFITNKAARSLIENTYPFRMDCDRWHIFEKEGYIDVKALVPYCVGNSEHYLNSNLSPERKVAEEEEASDNFFYYYFYKKFIFQIFTKHLLSLKKQKRVW